MIPSYVTDGFIYKHIDKSPHRAGGREGASLPPRHTAKPGAPTHAATEGGLGPTRWAAEGLRRRFPSAGGDAEPPLSRGRGA